MRPHRVEGLGELPLDMQKTGKYKNLGFKHFSFRNNDIANILDKNLCFTVSSVMLAPCSTPALSACSKH